MVLIASLPSYNEISTLDFLQEKYYFHLTGYCVPSFYQLSVL